MKSSCFFISQFKKESGRPKWTRFLLIAALISLLVSPALARRDIPDDNLSYPVSIRLSDGATGSGFYLNTDRDTFLVTAKHVLYKTEKDEKTGIENSFLRSPMATLLSYPKDPLDEGKIILSVDLQTLEKSGAIKKHVEHDVVLLLIGKHSSNGDQHLLSFLNGVVLKQKAETGLIGVGSENLKKLADVLTANEVFIFGYPTSIGLKQIPQLDYSRPLLRKGIVAGINRKTETIVLDCPVYKGNSGGPVLEVEREENRVKLRVIGVVYEFVPFAEHWENKTQGYSNISISNSGYSMAAPADAIIDLVDAY